MIKPIYKYLYETMVKQKLLITFISSFFVLVSYKIVSLTYDHEYLQLLILNNGKRKIFYDIYKLVFHHDKLHPDNIGAGIFYNNRSNYEYNYVKK